MVRGLFRFALFAVAVELCAPGALADEPAQQAHALMREVLLERAAPTAQALAAREVNQPAAAIAREHTRRMSPAEAERAAHYRAVEHGSRRSGAGRPDRDVNGAHPNMHEGGSGDSGSRRECQDAASNWRTEHRHGEGMPSGEGMPTDPHREVGDLNAGPAAPEQPAGR
jgi:hypothetical protein